jgi:uncharacterized protein (TIGR02246 family)
MTSSPITESDRAALHLLPLRYARACDTHDAAEFADIFTEDGIIVSPGHTMTGRDQIVTVVPVMLKQMYIRTMHLVHNDLSWPDPDGDTATGETYCLAHHLTRETDGRVSDFIMAITYANRYRKTDGIWRFAHRRLHLNWTQTTTVDVPDGG